MELKDLSGEYSKYHIDSDGSVTENGICGKVMLTPKQVKKINKFIKKTIDKAEKKKGTYFCSYCMSDHSKGYDCGFYPGWGYD